MVKNALGKTYHVPANWSMSGTRTRASCTHSLLRDVTVGWKAKGFDCRLRSELTTGFRSEVSYNEVNGLRLFGKESTSLVRSLQFNPVAASDIPWLRRLFLFDGLRPRPSA
eukprot:6186931-Pleurochrysis_carterae.AAC.3